MTSHLDKLLNASFKELKEQSRTSIPKDESKLIPDSEGCIYQICSFAGNTLDVCSTLSQAEAVARNCYHEYEIWKIYTGSSRKTCIMRYERRHFDNIFRTAPIRSLKGDVKK